MSPLLGTKNPSAPVGDKSGGDRRAARAAAFQVFTNHGFCCGAAWGGYGAAWAAWATRAAASLFTIVHHCSRLFGIVQQKILRLSQCPLSVLTGKAAGKVFTKHETRDKHHGLYAFHQTRDMAFKVHRPSDISSGVNQAPVNVFHKTRITKHESRLFFELRPFCRVGRPAGFKGGCTKRCVNEWKEVYLNPETKITTFSESRLGSRPGISHYFPQ